MNKIQKVLDDQRRTQKWLSEQIDRTPQTINKWCKNDKQPNLVDLIAISVALGVTTQELIQA